MYVFYASGFSHFFRSIARSIFGDKQSIYTFASINFLIFSPRKKGSFATGDSCYDHNLVQLDPTCFQTTTRYTEPCKWLKRRFCSRLTYAEENNLVESCCSTSENKVVSLNMNPYSTTGIHFDRSCKGKD